MIFYVEAPNAAVFNVALRVGGSCDDCGGWFSLPDVQVEPVELPSSLLPERLSPADLDRMKLFVEVWKTRKITITHKSNIVVTLAQNADSLEGRVSLVNPDGTETEVKIVSATVENHALAFQTADDFQWRLILNKRLNTGILRGNQHEMFIEETVAKER